MSKFGLVVIVDASYYIIDQVLLKTFLLIFFIEVGGCDNNLSAMSEQTNPEAWFSLLSNSCWSNPEMILLYAQSV